MKLPRDLGGGELVKILCKNWDYTQVHQVGSHAILETKTPSAHRLSVPMHDALRVGTLNAILRSVANHKGTSRQSILERS